MKRIRQDYEQDRIGCVARREHEHRQHGYAKPKRHKPCALPDECELCWRWVCNACELTVSWEDGGGEVREHGGGLLCDACWCKYIEPWRAAQDVLDKVLAKHYALTTKYSYAECSHMVDQCHDLPFSFENLIDFAFAANISPGSAMYQLRQAMADENFVITGSLGLTSQQERIT